MELACGYHNSGIARQGQVLVHRLQLLTEPPNSLDLFGLQPNKFTAMAVSHAMADDNAYGDGFGRIHHGKLRGCHFSDRYFAGGDGAHPSLGELKTAAVDADVSVFFKDLQHQPGFGAIADKSPDVGLAAGSRAGGGTGIRPVRTGPAFLAGSGRWLGFVHESTIPGLQPANNSSGVALTPVIGSRVTAGRLPRLVKGERQTLAVPNDETRYREETRRTAGTDAIGLKCGHACRRARTWTATQGSPVVDRDCNPEPTKTCRSPPGRCLKTAALGVGRSDFYF